MVIAGGPFGPPAFCTPSISVREQRKLPVTSPEPMDVFAFHQQVGEESLDVVSCDGARFSNDLFIAGVAKTDSRFGKADRAFITCSEEIEREILRALENDEAMVGVGISIHIIFSLLVVLDDGFYS